MMSLDDEFDMNLVLGRIAQSFAMRQPDLCGWLGHAEAGPDMPAQGALRLILAFPKRGDHPATVDALAIIDELHRLLDHEQLGRAEARRRILAGLTIATLLGRPQFGTTGHATHLCELGAGANLASDVHRLRKDLARIYSADAAEVQILFPVRRRGGWTYAPEFRFAKRGAWDPSGRGWLEPPSPPPERRVRSVFTSAQCAAYLAASTLQDDRQVIVVAGTGDALLGERDLLRAAADPRRRAPWVVAVPAPGSGGATDEQAARALHLAALSREGGSPAPLEVLFEQRAFDYTAVQTGCGDLLVRASPGEGYQQLCAGDPLHAYFRSWVADVAAFCGAARAA